MGGGEGDFVAEEVGAEGHDAASRRADEKTCAITEEVAEGEAEAHESEGEGGFESVHGNFLGRVKVKKRKRVKVLRHDYTREKRLRSAIRECDVFFDC